MSGIKYTAGREEDDAPRVTLTRANTSGAMYRSLPVPFRSRSPKPVWVLSHSSCEALARDTVAACHAAQEAALRNGLCQEDVRPVEFKAVMEWRRFKDGFPNVFIKNVKEMAGKDVIFIASFHSAEVIFEQLSLLYVLPRYLAHSVTVILPYFPTGTMERVDLEGQVATAKTLATMVSAIPPTGRGPCQIVIYDIHALQERFYFGNDVIPRLETAIPLLIRELEASKFGADARLAIAFPDDGAEKRFSSSFPEAWSRIVCGKHRDGDRRFVKIKEGDPKGAHVVIIDDLVQTGGTLWEAGKLMRAGGAVSVSAFVTHAVFPAGSWRRFTHAEDKEALFSQFWVTDSLPHGREIAAAGPPFRLLSLGSAIAESLLGFDLQRPE